MLLKVNNQIIFFKRSQFYSKNFQNNISEVKKIGQKTGIYEWGNKIIYQ